MNRQELEYLRSEVQADRVKFMEHLTIVRWSIIDCNNAGLRVPFGIMFGIEYNMYKLSKELFLDCLDLIIHNRSEHKWTDSYKSTRKEMLKYIAHRLYEGLM